MTKRESDQLPATPASRSLVDRLRANSCVGPKRDEMLIEMGKMQELGLPDLFVNAIGQWNDLMVEAAEALSARSESAATVERPEWLIWSNEHRAWWGHERCGYPETFENAGRYTLTEARKICRSRHWTDGRTPPETMIHIDEVLYAG